MERFNNTETEKICLGKIHLKYIDMLFSLLTFNVYENTRSGKQMEIYKYF